MTDRDPFAAYRERLALLGFRPSRRLGQNFLLEPELHRVMADAAAVGADDVVLEIGAGLGFLTRELAGRARRVVAVEIDHRLCEVLREDLVAMPGGDRVELVQADVLGRHGELGDAVLQVIAAAGAQLKVVANLPYAVTGPVLATLCTAPALPARMAVLVQLEVATRLCAAPRTSEYGSLTALVQACFAVRLARRVGREVFRPRPNVDSGIVEMVRARDCLAAAWSCAERRSFAAFVRGLFSARRKMVRHGLARAAAAAGIPPPDPGAWSGLEAALSARPGDLDPPMLAALWRAAQARP